MAKCDICGRGAFFGNQVSHSHRRSKCVPVRSSVHKAYFSGTGSSIVIVPRITCSILLRQSLNVLDNNQK